MTTKPAILPDLDPARLPVLIELAQRGGWTDDAEAIKFQPRAFLAAVKVTIKAIDRETRVLEEAVGKAETKAGTKVRAKPRS